MKFFSNLNIKAKLIASFIVMAVVTVIVGVAGAVNMSVLNTRSENMYYNNSVPALRLSELQTNLQNVRANHLMAIYERDQKTLQSRLDEIDKLAQDDTEILKQYESTIQDEKDRSLYEAVTNNLETYRSLRNENINLVKVQKYDEALATSSKVSEARNKVDEAVQKLVDYNKSTSEKTISENATNFKNQTIVMVIIIIVGIILAIVLGLTVAGVISKPLNLLVGVSNSMADGNLDVEINIYSKDEVGILAQAFKRMANNMNEVMQNIRSASDQVATGAKQVSDSSIELSQGATEQASSIEQLTASVEEIAAQTRQNADNANEANELAEVAKKNAVQGNGRMKEMLDAMEAINESSSNISKIIKVIDEIAFQTNILALNAAVEAARAGQHGKGFAVVAEEVRNLAARSADAAKETTSMIEESIKKVEGGTTIASETAEALNSIVDGIDKVANIVGNIATASNEQASGIAQINQGIMQVSGVVQTNSATSEESAAASEELSSQAQLLKGQVAKFKLRKNNYSSYNGMDELNPDVLRMLENMERSKRKQSKVLGNESYKENTTKKIVLSDEEFGKY